MNRRSYLAGVAALASLGGVAGCLSSPGGPGADPSPTESPSFSVDTRDCGNGTDAATVSFEGDRVVVDGTASGSDSCDTAELDGVTVDGDTLELRVAVVREDTEGTAACLECLTDIEYTLRVTNATAGRVRVVHVHGDEDETVTTAERT